MSKRYKLYLTAQSLLGLLSAYFIIEFAYAIYHDKRNTEIGIQCFEDIVQNTNFKSIKLEHKTWDAAKDALVYGFSENEKKYLFQELDLKCPGVFRTMYGAYFNNVRSGFSYDLNSQLHYTKLMLSMTFGAMLGLFVLMKWLFWLLKKDEPLKSPSKSA